MDTEYFLTKRRYAEQCTVMASLWPTRGPDVRLVHRAQVLVSHVSDPRLRGAEHAEREQTQGEDQTHQNLVNAVE